MTCNGAISMKTLIDSINNASEIYKNAYKANIIEAINKYLGIRQINHPLSTP
jgi:hypothetical protein